MPHLTFEYSTNAQPGTTLGELFQACHQVLVEVGGINIGNCKSRAYVAQEFSIGSGEDGQGFVHLDVRFLEGRSQAVINGIGERLLNTLQSTFGDAGMRLNLQITVEILDIAGHRYFKYPAGTLTPQ